MSLISKQIKRYRLTINNNEGFHYKSCFFDLKDNSLLKLDEQRKLIMMKQHDITTESTVKFDLHAKQTRKQW